MVWNHLEKVLIGMTLLTSSELKSINMKSSEETRRISEEECLVAGKGWPHEHWSFILKNHGHTLNALKTSCHCRYELLFFISVQRASDIVQQIFWSDDGSDACHRWALFINELFGYLWQSSLLSIIIIKTVDWMSLSASNYSWLCWMKVKIGHRK